MTRGHRRNYTILTDTTDLRWHRHIVNGGKIDRTYWEMA